MIVLPTDNDGNVDMTNGVLTTNEFINAIFGHLISGDNVTQEEFSNIISLCEEKGWESWKTAWKHWKQAGLLN